MPIKYQVIHCSNPAGDPLVDYACCRAAQENPITAKNFVDKIEQDTSYTRADIVGVMTAMAVKIREHLLAGMHVDLKDGITNLGIIYPGIKSECFPQTAIASPDFNPATYLEGAKINMRPSNELKNEFLLRASTLLVDGDLVHAGPIHIRPRRHQ